MSPEVHGRVAAGFEPVRAAFRSNFDELGDLGAAFAAYVEGRSVVDVWAGAADACSRAQWDEGTLQLLFSGTKGLTAACVLLVTDRGLVDVERPVADYWPEFATGGKERITVADVLTHEAGLAAVTTDLEPDQLLDPVSLTGILERQSPHWEPGRRLAYHGLTFGWLCDGLMRRVAGASIARFFAAEIATPLELEVWIGLPAELEERVSRVSVRNHEVEPPASPYGRRVFFNPPVFAEPLIWNRPEFHSAELPAVNGIATARSMARFYACLAQGGTLDGVTMCSRAAVERATGLRVRGADPYTGEALAFGLGFELQTEALAFGPPLDAFGHTGAGGSVHGAWPRHHTGFSYCMNEMRPEAEDRRGRRLLAALYSCIA